MAAAYEMPSVIYTIRIEEKLDINGNLQPMPWNKDPEIQEYVDNLALGLRPARQQGVYLYSLGDEISTRGCDLSASDMAAYRVFIQGKYKNNITELNHFWGSSYSTFDEINLLNATERYENLAIIQKNFPRWYDRKLWQNENMLRFCERFKKAFRDTLGDPKSLTGFEGTGDFYSGDDIEGFLSRMDWWSPYPAPANEAVRSLAPSTFPHSNWIGYSTNPVDLMRAYWKTVLDGCHGVFWWMWANVGQYEGLLRPDLTVSDDVSKMMKDTAITREGLGDLLLRSSDYGIGDEITIFYSRPSAVEAVYLGNYYFQQAHGWWQTLLYDLGFGFSYITDSILESGTINPKTRLIVLPRVSVVSPNQVKHLTEFVNNGGTLIADYRLGRWDSHMRPIVGSGPLDNLFGVNSSNTGYAYPATTAYFKLNGMPLVDLSGQMRFCPGTISAGANSFGNASYGGYQQQTVFVNNVGTKGGHAILLNFELGTANLNPIIEKLINDYSGIISKFRFNNWNANNKGHLRVNRWSNGQVVLAGVLADGTSDVVNINLGESKRVLNLRKGGEDLGVVSTITFNISFGRATFFAMFPASFTGGIPQIGMRFTTTKIDTVKVGHVANLELKVDGALCDHGAFMTANKPDGSDADWLKKVIVIPIGQSVNVPIPVALNDPEGDWVIKVKDIFGSWAIIHMNVTKYDVVEPPSSEVMFLSIGNNHHHQHELVVVVFWLLMAMITIIH